MHIAIAGNIGCGKTTLTKLLAEHYGWQPRFESVSDNPYLSDFYADMERWSFNLQIYFLNRRFKEVVEISKTDDIIVQDRTIFEDGAVLDDDVVGLGNFDHFLETAVEEVNLKVERPSLHVGIEVGEIGVVAH